MAWFRDLPAPGRAVAAGVMVVVVMALGAVLVGVGSGRSSTPPATPPAGEGVPAAVGEDDLPAGHGPSGATPVGVGVGFGRDENGAVAAAVSYATAPQGWLYLSDEDVRAVVEGIVVPEARDGIAGEVVQEIRLLRTELEKASGTVWFVVAPLATRVEDFDPESGRAVVRVWSVRVLSAEGVAVPQSGWQTTTFRLRWQDDGWKIASTRDADGPVPQLEVGLQPWTAGYMGAELDGFVRVGVIR